MPVSGCGRSGRGYDLRCLFLDSLAHIIDDLFGGVVYAGIDTDKYKYPIGSGRVTFGNQQGYMKAVKAGFVEIKTPNFTKKVTSDRSRDYHVTLRLSLGPD